MIWLNSHVDPKNATQQPTREPIGISQTAIRLGARLTVWREGQEEFSFAIHGLVREPLTFAFPAINLEPEEIHPRAEIILPTGRIGGDWDLDELSRDKIYDEFINAYARWIGW